MGALLLGLAGVARAEIDPAARAAVEAGDRAWARRAEGAVEDRAAREPIREAVAAYEEALVAAPDDLEVLVRLARALHFEGEYTGATPQQQVAIWERGTGLAERSIALLGESQGGKSATAAPVDPSLAAAVHFWAAIHWGLWGEAKGALAAVRKGIAKRIRDHAEAAIELDPGYERGGPDRLLGRLHAVAPRVPLFTGWVSRDEGMQHLERAVEIAPDEPANRLFLAEVGLAGSASERKAARRELEELLEVAPRPELLVEDRRTLVAARTALERAESPR